MTSNVIALVQFPKPPTELRELPAWLIWKFETKPGDKKPRKVPYYAHSNERRSGEQGSPDDLARLVTFKEALAAATRHKAAGVGIALHSKLELVALDFDDCVIDDQVRDDVAHLVAGTYAELSPSGNGVRAFFRGQLADRKSHAWRGYPFGFEVFCHKGFVTYTGNVLAEAELLGFDDTISPLPASVEQLYTARFERVMRSLPEANADPLETYEPVLGIAPQQMREALAKLDPDMPEPEWVKIGWAIHHETGASEDGRQLWHEWSSGGLSTDAAGKYDADRCDEKWEYMGRHRGSPITFRSVLHHAKQAAGERQTAQKRKRFHVVPAGEFSRREPPTWIVKGLLPKAELGVLYGESGSGKSFFVLDLVAAIARGVTWREKRVAQQPVVYVCAEGMGGFRNRLVAYSQFHGVDLDSIGSALGVVPDAPNLLSLEDHELLAEAVKTFGSVGVVVIDTLAQTTPGANENAAEDMGKAIAHCKAIHRATGALVLLVHHSGKDAARGARGWSGIKAAADVEIEIVRVDENRSAKVTKLKDGEDGAEYGFRLNQVVLGTDDDGDEVTSCVIAEAEVVRGAARLLKGLGEWQQRVITTLTDFCGLAEGGMERSALVAEVALLGEIDEDGRDRRKERARRALNELVKKCLLVENNGFVEVAQ